MDKETLEKINKFTRRNFREDELYVFPVTLCDNDIDRDGERFSDNALEKLKELYIGKTGIFNHDPKADNQTARIFDTEIVTDENQFTKYGQPYKYLKGMAYMARTGKNMDMITEIDAGIKKEVSVGCNALKKICSVCGKDQTKEPCEHQKGREYSGQICCHILDDVTDVYEFSFVAVPAQVNAGVTKKYEYLSKEADSMEFTPINTQAEFDAAVQSKVDAAVAETEKRFEGWISPEDAAALNTQLAEATSLNKSYAISALKIKAANEKGIPLALAERLSGENEEDIRKDADALAAYLAPKGQPAPKFSGSTAGSSDPITAAQLSMLSALIND